MVWTNLTGFRDFQPISICLTRFTADHIITNITRLAFTFCCPVDFTRGEIATDHTTTLHISFCSRLTWYTGLFAIPQKPIITDTIYSIITVTILWTFHANVITVILAISTR
eukprot:Lithocolla_globosa_v1_NODE_631_length_3555_cov_10.210571.p3 type:complete len:111 gc:universal NODE_631_length_3555_cov_10.210571:1409-1077(-)